MLFSRTTATTNRLVEEKKTLKCEKCKGIYLKCFALRTSNLSFKQQLEPRGFRAYFSINYVNNTNVNFYFVRLSPCTLFASDVTTKKI